MKKLIIPMFALALAAGAPAIAWAQDDHHDDKAKPHAGQGDGAKPDTHEVKTAPKAPKADHMNMSGPTAMGGSGKNSTTRDQERERTRDLNRNGVKTDNKPDNNKPSDHGANSNDHAGSTNVHVNINIGGYREAVTSSRHFRIGTYHAPAHYSYRRWGIGERLPNEYYARDYWLSDFAAYDLVAPPDGYVWVRFGPDALLIDEDSGEVIQVVYGVFI